LAPDCVKLIGLCFADEHDGGQLLLENILIYIIDRFCYEKHLASDIIRMDNEEKGVLEGVGYTLLGIVLFGLIGLVAYRNKDTLLNGDYQIPISITTFVANVMPFSILAYGFAGDAINQEFRLSIPSIAAFASIVIIGPLSQVFAKYTGGNLDTQDTSGLMWCTIPGLEGAESPYFPTAFISTSIIAFYYLCWAWHTSKSSESILLAFGLIWLAQFATFIMGDCSVSYKPLFSGSVLINIIISTVIGIAIGAISFGGASTNPSLNPYNLPGGSTNGGSGGLVPTKLSKCPDGSVPIDGKCPYKTGHSYPVQDGGDENTFVAELYKNGQLVTQSIAE